MTLDPAVTRGEFAMLAKRVDETARRLDAIDQSGTRGIGAMSVQIGEVIKDIAAVNRELTEFRTDHAIQHSQEQMARQSARRWMIGTLIALLVALEGPLAYLVVHVR